MKFLILNYIGKADWIASQIVGLDYKLARSIHEADVMLIDSDSLAGGRAEIIGEAATRNIPVILYPHGGNPSYAAAWDGDVIPHPGVTEVWVPAYGHQILMGAYKCPHETKVIGWPYGELRPARKTTIHTIAFAPEHPPFTHKHSATANAIVYDLLRSLELPRLVVRAIGSPADNGLDDKVTPGIYWAKTGPISQADTYNTWRAQCALIDASDVVVASNGTFAHLAIARGCPTVIYDSHHVVSSKGKPLPNLKIYQDLIRYPIDLDTTAKPTPIHLLEAMHRAAEQPKSVAAYRQRWIGHPLNLKARCEQIQLDASMRNAPRGDTT